jgi:pantothenate kinase
MNVKNSYCVASFHVYVSASWPFLSNSGVTPSDFCQHYASLSFLDPQKHKEHPITNCIPIVKQLIIMFTHKIPSCGSLPHIGCDTLSPIEERSTITSTTYELLARNAIQALEESNKHRIWIAVCGGPGAGKTTLALAVADLIDKISSHSIKAMCISMDGYHYSRAQLHQLGYGIKRRGAPWTFDAERLTSDLQTAQQSQHSSMWFPGYSREISDPVERQVSLEADHRIVLVEGNYVMLGKLMKEYEQKGVSDCLLDMPYEYDGPRSIHDEIKRWEQVTKCFDYTWFVHPCDGYDEQRRRLIQRALRTWSDAKTLEWGGGTSLEAATFRVDYNDHKNAALVDCCRKYADVVVPSV